MTDTPAVVELNVRAKKYQPARPQWKMPPNDVLVELYKIYGQEMVDKYIKVMKND